MVQHIGRFSEAVETIKQKKATMLKAVNATPTVQRVPIAYATDKLLEALDYPRQWCKKDLEKWCQKTIKTKAMAQLLETTKVSKTLECSKEKVDALDFDLFLITRDLARWRRFQYKARSPPGRADETLNRLLLPYHMCSDANARIIPRDPDEPAFILPGLGRVEYKEPEDCLTAA